ncbi:hypothetical protein [Nannocystis sp. SCPEA4]|uniref:hypothetical protein n=1 Tax=Nannocystis sp. SCPEA4 TaxID=2996787 RepID=UPI0022703265|nr:hypothetical protein [Nannocystis sp. SCPEA4]MCY1054892.1 hypothetical protein [Nannocystis sp. SCPEA4]
MSTCPRLFAWSAALVLGACFNPTGQSTDATSDSSPPTAPTDGLTTADTVAPTTGTTNSSSGSDSITGEPDPTEGSCTNCERPTPYCAGDACIGCQDLPAHDLTCADVDANRPHCDSSGECVGCVLDEDCGQSYKCHPDLKTCVACVTHSDCGGTLTCDDGQCLGCVTSDQCPSGLPVCDAGACRTCRAHGECPVTACEIDVGTCFPPAETKHRYVDPKVPCQDSACDVGSPCCAAYEAVDQANTAVSAYHVIHVKGGLQTALIRISTPGKRVAILGEFDGTEVEFSVEAGQALALGDDVGMQYIDSKLFVANVRVNGSLTTSAMVCSNAAHLWLDEVTVTGTLGPALHTTGCTLTARRSLFRGNSTGVSSAAGGVARLENSIIGDTLAGAPLQIVDGGTLDLLYTTVVDKGNVGEGVLKCITEAPVSIRNSILVGVGGEIQCMPGGPSISHTVTTVAGWPGEGLTEVTVDAAPALFADHAGGDYHLGPNGAALDMSALRLASDPLIDIDGQPRPAGDNVPDFAGADRP